MSIVIVGMLDEREEALKIIKQQIERRGHKTVLIDMSIGTGGITPSLRADIDCHEIASLGGGTIDGIKKMLAGERDRAISIMAEGLTQKISDLYEAGTLRGMISIGGMTGTVLSFTAMKALPFGVPKLLISSAAAIPTYAARLTHYFGPKDITVMHSVVDTVGLNPLIRAIAVNGANAICGMVDGFEPVRKGEKPSIALSEFGFVDQGAHYVRELLEKDYDLVSFHAIGVGDRAAVDLLRQGFFEAFVDLVPGSFGDYLLGGNRAPAGPDRLDGPRDLGIPYFLAPGGFDMISCGPLERKDRGDPLWVSRKLAERKLFIQDGLRVQARTGVEEMEMIGKAVAEKLNQYEEKHLVKFFIPQKGFSSLSVEGGPLHDPVSDQAFVDGLKKHLDPAIRMIEVATHINTPEFAKAIVQELRECLKKTLRIS